MCIRPANDRRRYNVTWSVMGWARGQNGPCYPIWPWSWNISEELVQYYRYWCPGSLRRLVIVIDGVAHGGLLSTGLVFHGEGFQPPAPSQCREMVQCAIYIVLCLTFPKKNIQRVKDDLNSSYSCQWLVLVRQVRRFHPNISVFEGCYRQERHCLRHIWNTVPSSVRFLWCTRHREVFNRASVCVYFIFHHWCIKLNSSPWPKFVRWIRTKS